jgi:hypothetical protein
MGLSLTVRHILSDDPGRDLGGPAGTPRFPPLGFDHRSIKFPRVGRNRRDVWPTTCRLDDAAPRTQAARVAHPGDVGWSAGGRRTQAEWQATRAAAQATRSARRTGAAAYDAPHCLGGTLTEARGNLTGRSGCHPSIKPRFLPDRSLLGPIRSPSRHRRGRLSWRAPARTVGAGGPNSKGHQPSDRPTGPGLVGSLPRASPRQSARGSASDGVCAAELLQTSSGAAGRRSPQFGPMVPWVGRGAAGAKNCMPGRDATNVARGRGLATCGRPDRFQRSPTTPNEPLNPVLGPMPPRTRGHETPPGVRSTN